nr:tyrosine-type recombinase/integrase [Ruegeria atlantica]
MAENHRDLALFNMAIDSKLRDCDLVKMKDELMVGSEYLWPERFHERLHISTRQYARLVRDWVMSIGLEASAYGTHSLRRTKVTQIYKKTGNLHAVQLLLGHTKMDSAVRYLGVELEDALAIAEAIEI